jgi:serine protease Do
VASTPVNKTVLVEVMRRGKKKSIKVKIGELEEEAEAKAEIEEKSDLGMTVEKITPELVRQFGLSERSGLVVVHVEKNSPAEKAGIRPGDILVEIDQEPINELGKYREKLQEYEKGDTILFLVKRKGTTLYLTMKIWE